MSFSTSRVTLYVKIPHRDQREEKIRGAWEARTADWDKMDCPSDLSSFAVLSSLPLLGSSDHNQSDDHHRLASVRTLNFETLFYALCKSPPVVCLYVILPFPFPCVIHRFTEQFLHPLSYPKSQTPFLPKAGEIRRRNQIQAHITYKEFCPPDLRSKHSLERITE